MTTTEATLSLMDLAERVEQLSGPDREVEALIWLATQPFPMKAYNQRNALRARGLPPMDRIDFAISGYAPAYTTSIDAAMSLVPEGWRTGMVSEMVHRDDWHWRLVAKRGHDRYGKAGVNGVARTLALALCSAALRARAAQGEG